MPITVVRKAAKLPSYLDAAPPPALRREHAIAARHLPKLTRAYLRTFRSIYGPEELRAVAEGYRALQAGEGTVEKAVGVVSWFNQADPLAAKRWELLGLSLEAALVSIVEDAGQSEARQHGWPFRFTVSKAAAEMRVPINPFSLAWIRIRAAADVKEISDQQRNLLREILIEAFEEGMRPDAVLRQIEMVVGLTSRERGWVLSRRDQLAAEGLSGAALERATDRYAARTLRNRAKRIARTETIDAYAQGLDDSWELAKEEGHIDGTTMQRWVELSASGRTCEICRGLGESEPVPVGEPFVSDIVGEVRRPPAHPHCRCTKVLVFPDDAEESLANANRDAAAARDRMAGG